MRAADLELLGGGHAVDLLVVKLLEDMLEKRVGQAFGQLFFSQFRMNPNRPWVEGLRQPPLRSGCLTPSTQGRFLQAKPLSPFELPRVSFCSRPDTKKSRTTFIISSSGSQGILQPFNHMDMWFIETLQSLKPVLPPTAHTRTA